MNDLRYQTQKYRHRPEEGTIGDCFPTCLASLLEIPRDDVPHFFEDWEGDPVPQWDHVDTWLREEHGVMLFKLTFNGAEISIDTLLNFVSQHQPGYRYMLSGISRNAVNHVVICKNGKIDHDPSIDQSGVIGPSPDGHYWIEFLMPIDKGFEVV